MPLPDLLEDAQRQLTLCNACRYCEGYCAVFPALELRTEVTKGDAVYLANLCHDCRACYYACPFIPPHEFAINLPEVLSAVRVETYATHGWPAFLSRALGRGPMSVMVASACGILAILGLVFAVGEPRRMLEADTEAGSFYRILPYLGMVLPFLALAVYVLVVTAGGVVRFSRSTRGRLADLADPRALLVATWEALTLRYLEGGGDGCYYPADDTSNVRRWLHAVVFYGFLAAFAATVIAAIMQDFLEIMPPYPLLSAPVVLGSAGGIAMIVGTAALALLKWRSDPRPAFGRMVAKDYGFLVTLNLVSVTGMLTLALRTTPAMGTILVIHLGSLVAFFLTMPYGKFVHLAYRYAALVRNRIEMRRGAA